MIPLLPLLALVPPAHPWFVDSPSWVDAALRDASPSAPSHYLRPTPLAIPDGPGADAARRAAVESGRDVVLPNGRGTIPGKGTVMLNDLKAVERNPNASPDDWTLMNRRARDLMARGEFEAAYLEEEIGHDAFELVSVNDPLADAALLTRRYGRAETLLVQQLRNNTGGVNTYPLELSLALAMQGRVYAGQGAYVLAELRAATRYHREEIPLAGALAEPTAPVRVAALSVLAIGLRREEPVYLEWALRLDPASELAGTRLVALYGYRHRDADAARVAASMVDALPAGAVRDGFAARLKEIRGRIALAPAPTKKVSAPPR